MHDRNQFHYLPSREGVGLFFCVTWAPDIKRGSRIDCWPRLLHLLLPHRDLLLPCAADDHKLLLHCAEAEGVEGDGERGQRL